MAQAGRTLASLRRRGPTLTEAHVAACVIPILSLPLLVRGAFALGARGVGGLSGPPAMAARREGFPRPS